MGHRNLPVHPFRLKPRYFEQQTVNGFGLRQGMLQELTRELTLGNSVNSAALDSSCSHRLFHGVEARTVLSTPYYRDLPRYPLPTTCSRAS